MRSRMENTASLLRKQQTEDDKDIEQMESMWKKMHDALTYEGKTHHTIVNNR